MCHLHLFAVKMRMLKISNDLMTLPRATMELLCLNGLACIQRVAFTSATTLAF